MLPRFPDFVPSGLSKEFQMYSVENDPPGS
jgi:hypothetical protein